VPAPGAASCDIGSAVNFGVDLKVTSQIDDFCMSDCQRVI